MKNYVMIPWIKRDSDVFNQVSVGKSGRDSGYEYCIKSWEHWCKKNDVELIIMDKLIYPESEMLITWQRWHVLDLFEQSGIELGDDDQILMVDADSFIMPDTPNFFELTEMKFGITIIDGDYEWVCRNIKQYSQRFFNQDWAMRPFEYFCCCFVILNKRHKPFLDKLIKFYWENKDDIIDSYHTIRTGTDQGIVNIMRALENVEVKILPKEFSLMDLYRKNLLYVDQRCWWQDSLEYAMQTGWIFQFNAIPQNPLGRDRNYWMKRFYEETFKDK